MPDGILAAGGVAARIKKALLEEFNLHTVVRLPGGVFSPYTGIPTNILFFDRSGPTESIWFYEHAYPAGKKNYSKTSPLEYEEFTPLRAWWDDRMPNERAWRVPVGEAAAANYNLDFKNPSSVGEDFESPLPAKTSAISAAGESLLRNLDSTLRADIWHELQSAADGEWAEIELGEVLEEASQEERLHPEMQYRLLGVRLAAEGPYLRETKIGAEISATRLNKVSAGLFIYSRLFAWRGAFGIVPNELDGCYVSNEFPTYRVREERVLAEFLRLYFMRPVVWQAVEKKCQGTTKASRNRFKEEFLLAMRVTVPPMTVQLAAVEAEKRARNLLLESQALTDRIAALPVATMAALYRGRL